jgi:BMFP domain-containing protein YqiC
MQTENRLFDDLAKLATSAFGSLKGAREEVEARVKDQIERMLHGMDLVRREEFEVVRAIAAKARAENEALAARIAALEPKAKAKPRRAAKPRPARDS